MALSNNTTSQTPSKLSEDKNSDYKEMLKQMFDPILKENTFFKKNLKTIKSSSKKETNNTFFKRYNVEDIIKKISAK